MWTQLLLGEEGCGSVAGGGQGEREPALSEESRVPETLGKHLALTQLPSPHLSNL